jgi:hypothetical protein
MNHPPTLIPCRTCRAPVSIDANACPSCGAHVTPKQNYLVIGVVFLLGLSISAWAVLHSFGGLFAFWERL